jgi:hypothetical protein
MFQVICVKAQDWSFHEGYSFGANLDLHWGPGQRFPGLRLFAGFYATGIYRNHFLVNYGPNISIYTHTLGANLNPLVNDIEMDLNNAFSIGYGAHQVPYLKYFRTLNNGSFYNIGLDRKYALVLTSNFILNNHKRNQTVASISASVDQVTVNYYNDGGWPSFFPFADNFDRWWTGGIAVYGHRKDAFNSFEFSFDQFTGYQPLLFEAASLLGVNIPTYILDSTQKVPPDYNTSAYNLKLFGGAGYGANVGVIGSLRTNNTGTLFGLQDIIHRLGGIALHPNYDVNRIFIGGIYNPVKHVSF